MARCDGVVSAWAVWSALSFTRVTAGQSQAFLARRPCALAGLVDVIARNIGLNTDHATQPLTRLLFPSSLTAFICTSLWVIELPFFIDIQFLCHFSIAIPSPHIISAKVVTTSEVSFTSSLWPLKAHRWLPRPQARSLKARPQPPIELNNNRLCRVLRKVHTRTLVELNSDQMRPVLLKARQWPLIKPSSRQL